VFPGALEQQEIGMGEKKQIWICFLKPTVYYTRTAMVLSGPVVQFPSHSMRMHFDQELWTSSYTAVGCHQLGKMAICDSHKMSDI